MGGRGGPITSSLGCWSAGSEEVAPRFFEVEEVEGGADEGAAGGVGAGGFAGRVLDVVSLVFWRFSAGGAGGSGDPSRRRLRSFDDSSGRASLPPSRGASLPELRGLSLGLSR